MKKIYNLNEVMIGKYPASLFVSQFLPSKNKIIFKRRPSFKDQKGITWFYVKKLYIGRKRFKHGKIDYALMTKNQAGTWNKPVEFEGWVAKTPKGLILRESKERFPSANQIKRAILLYWKKK